MIYKYQGPLRFYYLFTRVLLTAIFALFAYNILKAAPEQSWIMSLAGLVMLFMAIYAAYESWIYLRALLNPVILTIEQDSIRVTGIGNIPIHSLRAFSFCFYDFNFGFPGMMTLISFCPLTISAEIEGQIKTKTFNIMPDWCMSAKKHEVLSALAAKYPGIKKERKQFTKRISVVYLDFDTIKAH